MESSDEEGEIVPNCVTDYHFLDHKEELVSFDALPLQWSQTDRVVHTQKPFFLVATVEDDRLRNVRKRVVAWRFDLSFVQPEVFVLSKDMNWIALQKPRKSFKDMIRTVLVTLHWLHFLKNNPETSGTDLWNYLLETFSSFYVEPSGKDLFKHMPLITEAVKRDKDLAKCKNPLVLMDKPKGITDAYENESITKKIKFNFDTDDHNDDDKNREDFNGDDVWYDHVCALCDNGGEILCCQGRCMRSFHATTSAGDGYCESLGYAEAQVKTIPTFLCPNCKHKQHQCYVCGVLGSSDNSSGAEVFPCISATCGHFYHPKCVAKLLEPANRSQAEELEYRISAGESFTCPVHRCFACKQVEDKKVHELQFAICRRCPRAYHRKCLPRTISFEKNDDEGIMPRAWDDLLPNRILIYCTNHDIIRELGTPARDHIMFPVLKGQQKVHSLWRKTGKPRIQVSITSKENLPKQLEKRGCSVDICNTARNIVKGFSGSYFNLLTKRNTTNEGELTTRSNLSINSKPYPSNSKSTIANGTGVKKAKGPSSSLKAEMENRILALMRESTAAFNREEFLRRRKLAASYGLFSQSLQENTITSGKVEGSVQAIRTALKKLDEGCSVEDAKAVCEPEILMQIFTWKRKLDIYLAPFLHATRYTSFGRHFTKVDKLKEVVNRLHYYVENGDTIVDFCCGSNDFSVIMKQKLEKTRKRCYFKNFDLIIPKNDFCFEQRDWMSIKLEELPTGSQLIMGLNPPFGVKASVANRFIYKALQFEPKLLILIVPEEARRLDQTGFPYDLVWEDQAILSGKSFYLPGSVDIHNKQLDDWNLKPPPLYLWSRRDWTVRHKDVAKECGHAFHQKLHMERNDPAEENNGWYREDSGLHSSGDISCTSDGFLDSHNEYDPEESDANLQDYNNGRCETENSNHGMMDYYIDMETSSTTHSPKCLKALRDAFGTPETEDVEIACQDYNSFQRGLPANVNS